MTMLFADSSLAYRLEAAHAWRGAQYVQAAARLFPDRGCTAQAIAGGFALYAGPGSPVNRALALGFERPLSSDDLDCVQEFYSQRGAATRLDLCPVADSSLLRLLEERAYAVNDLYSVLACSLTDWAPGTQSQEEVVVTQATPADADVWLQTVAQGFSDQDVPPADVLDMIAPTFHSERAVSYMAWVDGLPAGGAAMIEHDGVVELGSDSTRLQYRGLGVQQALIRHRLVEARRAGCELAMILTSPGTGSQRNAQRLGFQLMYTKATVIAPYVYIEVAY